MTYDQQLGARESKTATGVPGGQARYVLVAGFLGAGKTTLLNLLAAHLKGAGHTFGLVTNGQGRELVDTSTFRQSGFATEQVDGGCFSTQFDSLIQARNRLARTKPDFILAEPLGTCTDLVATVVSPLRQMHQATLAPLTFVVDAIRAVQMFGPAKDNPLSEKIAYIYRKQLEEADFIVINKTDLLSPERVQTLRATLQAEYPHAALFEVSARLGKGLEPWFDAVLKGGQPARPPVALDFDTYAEGQALLGWFNCTVELSSVKYFETGKTLLDLASHIQLALRDESIEVVHLKMAFTGDYPGEFALLHLVRSDSAPELARDLSEPVQSGELLINLRAEATPEAINTAVNEALLKLVEEDPRLFARMGDCEHFSPPRQEPAHRL